MQLKSLDSKPLDQTHELILNLVNSLDAMLAYWDREQVCRFANNAYFQWFGIKPDKLIGMTMEELLGPLYAKNLPHIKAALAGQIQTFEREIPTPSGNVRYSLARYIPHIVEGKVLGIFVHVADVTPLKKLQMELKAAKEEAEKLATHDFLTGLPNRVLLFDRIKQALSLAKRTRRLVAGMTLDLDNFKTVNDTYGHETGDQLLIEIALRMQSSLREYDSVTRLGGDEFFILVPEIGSRSQIEAIAKHVVDKVRLPLKLGGITLQPTCSVGIALSTPDDMTPEVLMINSDRALYQAKNLGRDRYAFAEAGS